MLFKPCRYRRPHLVDQRQGVYELKKLRREVSGRFIEVNCATIRGDGAMSALFGHKRGAFTGATHDRRGLIREADDGIPFLDEVGELRLDEQSMLLGAIEEKRFLPVGSDREVQSNFQLLCGTNRDLGEAVRAGVFRGDLLSRINMWSFDLPGLAMRREDIEPNVHFELAQLTAATGHHHRFNKEALARFLAFAKSPEATWTGNFRDLNAAIARMATMALTGRITTTVVDREIERLSRTWQMLEAEDVQPVMVELEALLRDRIAEVDEFDRVQLAHVVKVCLQSSTLSAAGRRLFAASRARRSKPNDADRLRKYLAKFGLDWRQVVLHR